MKSVMRKRSKGNDRLCGRVPPASLPERLMVRLWKGTFETNGECMSLPGAGGPRLASCTYCVVSEYACRRFPSFRKSNLWNNTDSRLSASLFVVTVHLHNGNRNVMGIDAGGKTLPRELWNSLSEAFSLVPVRDEEEEIVVKLRRLLLNETPLK